MYQILKIFNQVIALLVEVFKLEERFEIQDQIIFLEDYFGIIGLR